MIIYFAGGARGFISKISIYGQRDIGDGRSVEIFDRNRSYLGLGYGLGVKFRIQLGWMNQATDNWVMGQAQLIAHHRFIFFK